jgi:hypothetical protein
LAGRIKGEVALVIRTRPTCAFSDGAGWFEGGPDVRQRRPLRQHRVGDALALDQAGRRIIGRSLVLSSFGAGSTGRGGARFWGRT